MPAGTTFGPFQIVHSLYTQGENGESDPPQDELRFFDTVLKAMELLEDDYLGGSGSRGSGQIAFEGLTLTFKSRECYENAAVAPIAIAEDTDVKNLRQSDYAAQISEGYLW